MLTNYYQNMETNFSRDFTPWVRGAQVMLGHRLLLIPNAEVQDHNLYEIDGHPGLQLKVYYYAQIQFLWKGRPIPTRWNSELDQRLVLKYSMEAPLPWSAMTKTAVEEALEFAQALQ